MELARDTLLNKVKASNDNGYPIALTYKNNKKITVKDNKLGDFWFGYCTLLDEYPEEDLGIGEYPKDLSPILIEGTVRFRDDYEEVELITDDFILKVVKAYWIILEEKFKLSKNVRELDCAYFLSPKFPDKNATRFRLQFPFCQVDPNYHLDVIRPLVIKLLKDWSAKAELLNEPESDWDEMLDPESIEGPTPLIGSSVPGIPKLEYQRIYHYNKKKNKAKSIAEIGDVFEPERHLHVVRNEISSKLFREHDDAVFWAPLIFSVKYFSKSTKFKEDTEDEPEFTITNTKGREDDPIVVAETLLPLISERRLNIKVFWRNVGEALHNITNGEKKGLDMWMEITKNKSKFKSKKCEKNYNKFEAENLRCTVKTIAFFARLDNPEAYEKWHKDWCFSNMERAARYPTDSNVAKAFYKNYWLDYVCYGESKKTWYKFKGHTWQNCVDALELSELLSDDFQKKFDEFIFEVSKRKLSEDDKDVRQSMTKEIGEISKFMLKLGNTNYKARIIRESAVRFHCAEFHKHMDVNHIITPFRNCVIEIDDDEGRAIIREGKPEDYMTRHTGMNFPKGLTKNSPVVKKYNLWVRQLFPHKALRREFKKWLSSLLRGKNIDKKLTVLTGVTNGGKSSLVTCIGICLGGFSMKLPMNIIEKESYSGAPNPAMARCEWARVCFLEEMDKTTEVPAWFVKKYTGDDKFYARSLNENGHDIDPGFKLVFVVNKIPKIKDADAATKDRLKPYPFHSVWKYDAPTDPREQMEKRIFKRNDLFSKQLPEMAKAMIWTMVEYYHTYSTEKFINNDEIKKAANEHWKHQDILGLFVKEKLKDFRKKGGEKVKLAKGDAFSEYKDWAIEKRFLPLESYIDFLAEMEERLGKLHHGRWEGWTLKEKAQKKRKNDESDDEDEDEEEEKEPEIPEHYQSSDSEEEEIPRKGKERKGLMTKDNMEPIERTRHESRSREIEAY